MPSKWTLHLYSTQKKRSKILLMSKYIKLQTAPRVSVFKMHDSVEEKPLLEVFFNIVH